MMNGNISKVDYNIIATGSSGNATVIEKSILIDCGISFKSLQQSCNLKLLKLVLLTHVHTDHFNISTIKKLACQRPALRWGVPAWLAKDLINCGISERNIDISLAGEALKYGSERRQNTFCTVFAQIIPHNVPNCAWHILIGEKKVFYATDTSSLDGIEAKNYDLYLVEANYEREEIAERIRQKQEAGEYSYEYKAMENHLSKEAADEWLHRNMGQKSRYVYMHTHSPFGM